MLVVSQLSLWFVAPSAVNAAKIRTNLVYARSKSSPTDSP